MLEIASIKLGSKLHYNYMEELKRIWRKFNERGVAHYAVRPRYIKTYSRHLFQTLKERWPIKEVPILVLEMKLEQRQTVPNGVIKCITSVESLMQYASQREFEDSPWNGHYVNELQTRFSRGDLCFGVFINGSIVSHLFVAESYFHIGEVGYVLDAPSGCVGFYDAYTLSTYRRRGLYEDLFNFCVNKYYQKGYSTACMWILPHNSRSILVHSILGMRRITQEVIMRQRWGIRWHKIRKLNIDSSELLRNSKN